MGKGKEDFAVFPSSPMKNSQEDLFIQALESGQTWTEISLCYLDLAGPWVLICKMGITYLPLRSLLKALIVVMMKMVNSYAVHNHVGQALLKASCTYNPQTTL